MSSAKKGKRVVRRVMQREVARMLSQPVYLFCMVVAPLFGYLFFTTLMGKGLPTDIPVGVVDEDNTAVTRQVLRNLDAFQQTAIVEQFANFGEAREAMQQGKIYAFYYIPQGTTEKALSSKQPKVSFYTNAAYLIPASLEYRDMKMMAELASGAIARETLYAKGFTDDQVMGVLQPIKMEMHAIGNPGLNYSIYLSNILLPAMLMLLIFQVTIYSIHSEVKEGTSKRWMELADSNIYKALAGKLLPQLAVWIVMGAAYMVILYAYWDFPLKCGLGPMALAALLLILVSQAFGVFLCELLPSLRWALSIATLWGVLSFPISGFSFPQIAFPAPLKSLSYLFPLRHYYLIYVDQALNGLPIYYSWTSFAALLAFLALPILFPNRLKKCLLEYQYTK
jgi:ABC-2 type transport system permease protein